LTVAAARCVQSGTSRLKASILDALVVAQAQEARKAHRDAFEADFEDRLGRDAAHRRVIGADHDFPLFGLDDLDRRVSHSDRSGKTTQYKLDEVGNAYERFIRLGDTAQYQWDVANRLRRVDYLKDASWETFDYDPAGNRRLIENPLVRYDFQYDALNHRISNAGYLFSYRRFGEQGAARSCEQTFQRY